MQLTAPEQVIVVSFCQGKATNGQMDFVLSAVMPKFIKRNL